MTIPFQEETPRIRRKREGEVTPPPAIEVKREGKDIKFQRGEKIGKGAFADVYKAIDQKTGELIAVKQIPINLLKEDQKRMIEQEVSLMSSLSHKNVVQFIGSQMFCYNALYPTHLLILMEYVPAKSLHELIREFGQLKEDIVRKYMKQILEGLAYCHEQKVIHRDIKGKNILVTADGTIKLADFGSAKLVDSIIQQECLSIGYHFTPLWLAPEVVSGKYNSKVDIWSAGCTMIEMASGKDPWSEHTFENSYQALYFVSQSTDYPLLPKLSAMGTEFLKLCLTRDPERRPAAAELLHHEWIVKGPPPPQVPSPKKLFPKTPVGGHVKKGIHAFMDASTDNPLPVSTSPGTIVNTIASTVTSTVSTQGGDENTRTIPATPTTPTIQQTFTTVA